MKRPPIELDMGFTVEEVAAGVERLLVRLGADAAVESIGGGRRYAGPGGVTIDVAEMPKERIDYPVFFPRTLVVLNGEPGEVDRIHQLLLLAFLRVGG